MEETQLAKALSAVAQFVRTYVVLGEFELCAVALWVFHTWTIDAAEATAYLSITSPEKQSGKTRLLETLELLVAKPWFTGRVSAAALVRKVHRDSPTLLLDETDTAFGNPEYAETLRGVLNTGYRRGGRASLCVKAGGQFDVQDFNTFSAKALAGIGRLPDTVADRSIPIRLKRRTSEEVVQRFRSREVSEALAPMRDALKELAEAHEDALAERRPEVPDALGDRSADVWEPLLAIADEAGGEWPEHARAAAIALSGRAAQEDASRGVQLLGDIHTVFNGQRAMSTKQLLNHLNTLDTSEWGAWNRGGGLDDRGLARLLKPHGVTPHSVRIGEKVSRGYKREDFTEPWRRYVSGAA